MGVRRAAVMAIVAAVAAAAWAGPQALGLDPASGEWVVAAAVFGPARGGGEDDAPALQQAVDALSRAGGGTLVLRGGEYAIASRVTVREGVTLRGEPARLTRLRITADRGQEEAPAAFTVERGSGLIGLSFWYPEQRLSEPVPYPWTVKTAAMPANDNQTIIGCEFVNSWKAVCVGPEGSELHTFRRLKICALKTGLSIDSVTDIGRLSEVTVAPSVWTGSGVPGAPEAQALAAYLLAQDTVAVDIGRSDWEYIWRLEVRGYRRGLVFRKGVRGTTNAVMADSRITGCGRACEVSALNQVGFSAYRSEFEGAERAWVGTAAFDAVVQFHSCRFAGVVANEGAGVVTLQGCDLSGAELAAAQGQVSAVDCDLGAVALGEVARARVLGFDAARARIGYGGAQGDVMVCAAARGGTSSAAPGEGRPRGPRPRAEALFVVTGYGASVTNADNAAAFQAALDAAGANAGGGTVYVPAGLYRFRGDLTVPAGVELRGCFDVPHHTVSAGSVLLVTHGRGQEEGAPFVSLAAGSGLRGLTFWYPEQPLKAPVPYPWTVRSLGAACWLKDVTIGNAWQGVDFATHRSDGHYISYLAGSMYRRGLVVGKSRGGGFVEDVQFNPHYAARLPQGLPRVNGEGPGDVGGAVIQFQRERLDGLVFTDCRDQLLAGTFLYAAYDGLAFRGSCTAQVLMHGTDTGSRGVSFETTAGSRVEFALAQLVSLGDWAKAAIVTLPKDRGEARFVNSQIWAGPATAVLEGRGTVRLEQFNTLSGPVEVRAGRLEAVNGVFERELEAHVAVSASAEADVAGTIYERGPLRVEGDPKQVRLAFNAASARPAVTAPAGVAAAFATSFEPGEPEAAADTVVRRGGGLRQVRDARCGAVERRDARSGARALRLEGVSEDPAYSFAYLVVHGGAVALMPDTTLTYWHKPLTAQGRMTGLDLLFSDGRVLRESGLSDQEGRGVSPGTRKGEVGRWTRIEVPLGKYAGLKVETVMAAYDTRSGGGRFEALFDDVRIEARLPPAAWGVRARPAGGRVAPRSAVRIEAGEGARVRYTLDGRNPAAHDPLYTGPLTLPRKGRVELRYTPLSQDGGLSRQVFAEVYEVGE